MSEQDSPATPSGCVLTPLRHLSIDLEKDIMSSLGPDFKGFFPNNSIPECRNSTNTSESSPTLIEGLTNSLEPTDKGQINKIKGNATAGQNKDPFESLSEQIDTNSVAEVSPELFDSNDQTVEKQSTWVNFD
jgi:hypothetical protein